MKRLLAVAVVIAAFGVGASGASAAPPNFDLPARQCSAVFIVEPNGAFYVCFWPLGTPSPFSETKLRAIRAVCEGAYRGTFELEPDLYRCQINPSS